MLACRNRAYLISNNSKFFNPEIKYYEQNHADFPVFVFHLVGKIIFSIY
jgi:hypothetical protein